MQRGIDTNLVTKLILLRFDIKDPIYTQEEIDNIKIKLEKVKLIKQPEQRSEEWHIFRNNRLTASDLATAINLNPYGNRSKLIASKCGYTPQYDGLQKLHENYGNELVVLGFPSNNFFWQEPGSNSEIKTFCNREYRVTFQMFEKIHVKGKKQHPIYNWLSDNKLNGWNDHAPSWNFCKYLIDEEGKLLEFYKSGIKPTDTLITRHLKGRDRVPHIIEN